MPQPEFDIGELVLYKNNQLIAFNKPAGLPVTTDKTGDKAMDQLGEIYCKSTLGLVHRLDRPASGVVLFARSENALAHLNEQFRERQVEKVYLAAVANRPEAMEGKLVHYLRRDGRKNKTIAYSDPQKDAKQAELSYRYLDSSDHYHLLEIRLHTGRHHQIRAQLADIGCPIKGDVKYGFRRSNPDRSIHLHAWKLTFRHPVSNQEETITAPLPQQDPVWNAFNLND
ncbi:RluA family pseudouridine synthase [Phaeodactylibacter sp.]|jgi:23S rRNA pseudouridine1911/1915/1917 synthase|uniref:RluA family pseudouridine synthase n=1 Tax=Phaeodactylibacter sp. TaxID=1940289 RepID=UPI0025F7D475|nr:RNA pseudouridine synthase [Phaeodactylibacter sp.]MCI4650796.1 RNA pseudouridine synthase [Phaeodactylibacter sp.]MCI5089753.1 RNA pseudouridine synthase [Phaeodactylibacter sp.]